MIRSSGEQFPDQPGGLLRALRHKLELLRICAAMCAQCDPEICGDAILWNKVCQFQVIPNGLQERNKGTKEEEMRPNRVYIDGQSR